MPETDPIPAQPQSVINISAYRFTPLTGLEDRRERLRAVCLRLGMKGTILLSPEGINLFVAADRAAIDQLLAELSNDTELGPLDVKESLSEAQPFSRMLVKIKREIIAFGVEGIEPHRATAPKLPAEQLKAWLDAGRPCTLLDVRNDYEIRLGTFENALPIGIDHFRQFPPAVERLPERCKTGPVVMFCTGGIRCEKAGPYLQQAGFDEVYQLEGGILRYFEQCGQDHYQGECFVFDKRVALDAQLLETETTLCYACQEPLTPDEQASPHYVPSESCPYCYQQSEAD